MGLMRLMGPIANGASGASGASGPERAKHEIQGLHRAAPRGTKGHQGQKIMVKTKRIPPQRGAHSLWQKILAKKTYFAAEGRAFTLAENSGPPPKTNFAAEGRTFTF